MTTWIFLIRVSGEKDEYYYDLDEALKEMPSHTIYQGQGRIKSIDVGDIVYFYECAPEKAIGWKCRVLAVDVPYEKTSDIDDKKFEHNYKPERDRDIHYIKVTAIGKYNKGKEKAALSLKKLQENGLRSKKSSEPITIRGSFRPQGELLQYINSIKPSEPDDD